MKKNFLVLFFLGFYLTGFSQSSFQVSGEDNSGLTLYNLEPVTENLISLFFHGSTGDTTFSILEMNTNEGFKAKGHKFSLRGKNQTVKSHFIQLIGSSFKAIDDKKILFYDKNILMLSPNSHWVRYVEGQGLNSIDIQTDYLVALSADYKNRFSIFKIDLESGDLIEEWGYEVSSTLINGFSSWTTDIVVNNNSEFILMGWDSRGRGDGTFLLKIDKNGEIIAGRKIQDLLFENKLYQRKRLYISPNGDIYIVDESFKDPITNQYDLNIIRFDSDLNLKFGKRFFADNFRLNEFTLNFDDSGDPVLAYSTMGAFPTIFARLNSSGEIKQEIGYGLYSPKIKFSNGALLFSSNQGFDIDGNTFPKNILSKTNSEGEIINCDIFDARLKSIDVDIVLDTFIVDSKFQTANLVAGSAKVEPYEMDFEPYCDFPPPPHPEFLLSDTICVGECIRTDSTIGNRNAQGVEWNLEGENLQLTVKDSLEFAHCFTQPGTYTLRQTIWFLGVDYSYEKIIEVLPPLSVEIVGEEILCDLPPVDLTADANRPLRGYEWSTGDTISSTQINEGGAYWLNANDGYCYARAEGNFEFIFEKIDTSLVINLPDSVTACEVLLPYELRPESNYSTVFENENSESNSVFLLSNPGVYEFSTEVDGCRFSKVINFKIDACKAEIFTPSAFSPNNDGINDIFLPFSPGIEPIRLSIYDRWGGKLFESNDSFVGWDGKRNGKISAEGVYVFRLEYVNLLTGLEEEISGDVTLVR